MRQIQPINIWVNGQLQQATQLNMYIVNDNLSTSATFYYQLTDANSLQLTQGNLTIEGNDYDAWGNSGDINNEAYVWAAGQLNLTLV